MADQGAHQVKDFKIMSPRSDEARSEMRGRTQEPRLGRHNGGVGIMAHCIVKLWPGKSERQKTRLAEEIAKSVMDVLGYGEESVSVAFEEVSSKDWAEKVYKPDIVNTSAKLYKKPGYTM